MQDFQAWNDEVKELVADKDTKIETLMAYGKTAEQEIASLKMKLHSVQQDASDKGAALLQMQTESR